MWASIIQLLIAILEKIIKKAPAAQQPSLLAQVRAAADKAEKTGDTSDLEKALNNNKPVKPSRA